MIELTTKQTLALDLLEDHDNGVSEIIYGGSAGSAKTFIGCYWILKSVLKYAGSRGALCRFELKALKKTTLLTFFDVCKKQGVKEGIHYVYKEQQGEIHFSNGSVVFLIQTPYLPSDRDFDFLGSFELTFVFMDEIAQIRKKAWDVMKTRIRFGLNTYAPDGSLLKDLEVLETDENGQPIRWRMKNGKETRGISPKLFGSLNPSKNWVYTYFYKPYVAKELETGAKRFIRALPTDNKFLDKKYLDILDGLPKPERDRLYLGIWETEDDTQLVSRDNAEELFNNDFVKPNGQKYIIGDVARLGSDRAVLGYFEGLVLKEKYVYSKSRMNELKTVVDTLRNKHKVPKANILLDEDGVGGGLVDFLKCKGFVNGSRPLNGENYENLKTQCYYYLAQIINEYGLFIEDGVFTEQEKEELFQEIEQIRVAPSDDGKLKLIKKDEIKSNIGRSPDFTDLLAMRMYFEIYKKNGIYEIY